MSAQTVGHSGDRLFVADNDGGMVILNISDLEPPQVFVTTPTFSPNHTSSASSLSLGGTATDNIGVTQLSWSNDRGGGGQVIGDFGSWLVNGVVLQPGTNVLTVTAFDAAGNSGSDTLTVFYQAPQQSQTITFPELPDRTFGTAPFALTAGASSGLPVQFTVFSGPASLTDGVLSLTGAGTVTVRASQPGNEQFAAATPVDRSFVVAKADQVIGWAFLPDKSADDAPFNLGATASSGLPVTFSIVSGPVTLDENTLALLGAGTVTVRAAQAGNANFNAAAAVERSFLVAKATQFITFGRLGRQFVGDAPFPLTALASSGLPVGFAVLSGPAVVNGGILTLTGPGLVVLRASQAGNENYAAAPPVDQVLIVAPGDNVIGEAEPLADGGFRFRFYGEPGTVRIIERSTDLQTWQPVRTNTVDVLGNLEFVEPAGEASANNFFRLREP